VLTSDGHDGVTYDLTGREAFSLGEAAALSPAVAELTATPPRTLAEYLADV
jgi:uncharacterized protein YbjT (DUF2867 family)